jgi:hypothetical protein
MIDISSIVFQGKRKFHGSFGRKKGNEIHFRLKNAKRGGNCFDLKLYIGSDIAKKISLRDGDNLIVSLDHNYWYLKVDSSGYKARYEKKRGLFTVQFPFSFSGNPTDGSVLISPFHVETDSDQRVLAMNVSSYLKSNIN